MKFKQNLWERCKDGMKFCGQKCMVKTGQSRYSVVICRKQSVFEMQFYLIVVSTFLKACVKDHGDRSRQLLQRKIW